LVQGWIVACGTPYASYCSANGMLSKNHGVSLMQPYYFRFVRRQDDIRVSANFWHFGSCGAGFWLRSLVAIFQFPFRGCRDRFDSRQRAVSLWRAFSNLRDFCCATPETGSLRRKAVFKGNRARLGNRIHFCGFRLRRAPFTMDIRDRRSYRTSRRMAVTLSCGDNGALGPPISVLTQPGLTNTQGMRRGAISIAAPRITIFTAALELQDNSRMSP
jgi:hypothetical protein